MSSIWPSLRGIPRHRLSVLKKSSSIAKPARSSCRATAKDLPMTVLEAWAYGLPVLMTDHCHFRRASPAKRPSGWSRCPSASPKECAPSWLCPRKSAKPWACEDESWWRPPILGNRLPSVSRRLRLDPRRARNLPSFNSMKPPRLARNRQFSSGSSGSPRSFGGGLSATRTRGLDRRRRD